MGFRLSHASSTIKTCLSWKNYSRLSALGGRDTRDGHPVLALGGRNPPAQPPVPPPDRLTVDRFEGGDYLACPPEGQSEVIGGDGESLGA